MASQAKPSRGSGGAGPAGVIVLGLGGFIGTQALILVAARLGGPPVPLLALALLLSVIVATLTIVAIQATRRARSARRTAARQARALQIQSRLRALALSEVPKPLAVTGPDGRLVLANPAFATLPPPLIEALAQMLGTPLQLQGPDAADETRTLAWSGDNGELGRVRVVRKAAGGGLILVTLEEPSLARGAPPRSEPFAAEPPPIDPPQDANAALTSALEGLAERIKESGADIRSSVLPNVQYPRAALERLLHDLVEAALESAVPERPLRIEIDGRLEDGQALFTLEDNGNGLGSGAEALADDRRGRLLTVEATPGTGTRVQLTLPAPPSRRPAPSAEESPLG
ncbi:ATP-binding protein [Pararhodospirillum photometricum]|uniref:Sensor protein n=1 Tax=Pararhodospirillum photometricum DSM 122 TaxID=1150469 RepID=H6SR85_PARPM|nr:ATP-binding protein [Pararhodospirillum photometricum]CCG09807.1 Sensor protein [Pararhodospirillum photometricum DSM 122]